MSKDDGKRSGLSYGTASSVYQMKLQPDTNANANAPAAGAATATRRAVVVHSSNPVQPVALAADPNPDDAAIAIKKRLAISAPASIAMTLHPESKAGTAGSSSSDSAAAATPVWVVPSTGTTSEIEAGVAAAAELLRSKAVVAFPTETVYGLGGNAGSNSAIEKIFAAKGRPGDNPLIVHVATMEQLYLVVTGGESGVNAMARQLMKAFWPGPLTFILPTQPGVLVARRVTGAGADGTGGGQQTVGVRMPSHPVALALIRVAGVPIAAPSANRSGKPSPTTAQHVIHDLGGRIAGVVDGGPTCSIGLESTVIDCTSGDRVIILRPGGITSEQLESVVGAGKVSLDPALAISKSAAKPAATGAGATATAAAAKAGTAAGSLTDSSDSELVAAPRAPGMKYVHYAPRAPLRLVTGSDAFIQGLIDSYRAAGHKVGVLTTDEKTAPKPTATAAADTKSNSFFRADVVLPCGNRSDPSTTARRLYDVLRAFDETAVDIILSETFPTAGLGAAVMNRLQKAAGKQYISEPANYSAANAKDAIKTAIAAAASTLPASFAAKK